MKFGTKVVPLETTRDPIHLLEAITVEHLQLPSVKSNVDGKCTAN